MKTIFHLLPNAHLDPVWLWDWREGLNEGITTVRSIADLMDEFPDLTFIRGESAIYAHIEKADPALFRRVARLVDAGRWDFVGGTVIQPDSNLAATETLCRQFEHGLSYFESRFGRRPTVSWQADSFGHTPGWPNILHDFGMEGFAFTRPQQAEFPLASPAFWWEGDFKNRLLCYRQHWKWYCSERANVPEILDATLAESARHPFRHVGVLMGLGNHGGGPSRRHLREVAAWREAHHGVEVRFSTLHGFFRELRSEAARLPAAAVPVVRHDLGYCLRGCYASVQKFKGVYRQAEAAVAAAQITQAVVAAPEGVPLREAWDTVLFNSFHDILPGSSIERAMEEQTAWVGLAAHRAREADFASLNALAARVDTSVPPPADPDAPRDVPILVWNRLPRPFVGLVEVEAPLDYRPLFTFENRPDEVPLRVTDARGRALPFQVIQTEHTSMPHIPWRKRVVLPLRLAPWGWQVVRLGVGDRAPAPSRPRRKRAEIARGAWRIAVVRNKVTIERDGKPFLAGPLALRVVEDPWGSWGGMNEEPDSYQLHAVRETWKVAEWAVLEDGPVRSKLWTRWTGAHSWIDLTFSAGEGSPCLEVGGRLLWNERSARLKLAFPCGGAFDCDVPGGVARRDVSGQVPAGRWARRRDGRRGVGVASDVLGDVDVTPDELSLTLARASRYANDVRTGPEEMKWQPAVDCGELKFQLALFDGDTDPDRAAETLLAPPLALIVPPAPGPLPGAGTLGRLQPESVRLLTAERLPGGGLRVRAQNRGKGRCHAFLVLDGKKIPLGPFGPQQIRTVIL